jgi:hypothetical protein
MVTSHDNVQRRRDKELTYHMGLRLAVMALRVEAALILASGRGRLEVRRDCARGHCEYLVWLEVRGEDVESSSAEGGVVGLKGTALSGSVGQERASNQQDELG